ncbi:hypothetical protein HOLDEFILI_04231 [Holdemania filiformis DSM 12042]|uniref:Uncharacterized protein n=1 Tax=Holdemania filiformis DSM 12042 TaxID=545696 RepID=B9YEF8_9FIRM|nr:hypothetical protein HOLDEFILI_04231 [Holdemania filiformis DSM 12042]
MYSIFFTSFDFRKFPKFSFLKLSRRKLRHLNYTHFPRQRHIKNINSRRI